MDALGKAIKHAGSQKNLADSIGLVPQVVNNWLRRGNVPADHCPAIERATAGAVTCEELRPDIDWGYLRGTRCAEKLTPATTAESQKEAA